MTSLKKRATQGVTPIVEGNQATFVWLGKTAPVLHGDMNWWGLDTPAVALKETEKGVWSATVTLPEDAYIEYAFFGDDNDGTTRQLDPLNPRKVSNGIGKYNNFFTMPAHQHAPERKTKRNVPKGRVTKHLIQGVFVGGGKRDVWLYQPPVKEPVPLLLVWDGHDYVFRAKLPTIVDNLIAQKRIQPVALACVQNAGAYRLTEYLTADSALVLATKYVLPLAQEHLNLLDINANEGAYGVLGASMGGLMALYAGLRLPNIFGHVISQSGAFQIKLTDNTPTLIEELLMYKQPPLKIWQDVGMYEWLYPLNQAIHQRLTGLGYDVAYREYSGGHNYPSWANQLADALVAIYPPR